MRIHAPLCQFHQAGQQQIEYEICQRQQGEHFKGTGEQNIVDLRRRKCQFMNTDDKAKRRFFHRGDELAQHTGQRVVQRARAE